MRAGVRSDFWPHHPETDDGSELLQWPSYDRPRIKLCSLTRLDNTGRDVPRSVHSIGKQDVCAGKGRHLRTRYTSPLR